jgi:hypothetical protein
MSRYLQNLQVTIGLVKAPASSSFFPGSFLGPAYLRCSGDPAQEMKRIVAKIVGRLERSVIGHAGDAGVIGCTQPGW